MDDRCFDQALPDDPGALPAARRRELREVGSSLLQHVCLHEHQDGSVYNGELGVAMLCLQRCKRTAHGAARDALLLRSTRAVARARALISGRRVVTLLEGHAGCVAVAASLAHEFAQRACGHNDGGDGSSGAIIGASSGNDEPAELAATFASWGNAQDIAAQLAQPEPFLGAALRLPPGECEVLYGRCGYLCALLFVRQQLRLPDFAFEGARQVVAQVFEAGLQGSRQQEQGQEHGQRRHPLLWEWRGKAYLGAAHGATGILHTLLQLPREVAAASEHAGTDYAALLHETALALLGEVVPGTGNLRSSLGSHRDRLVHWCHGAPGLVLLACRCLRVIGADGADGGGTRDAWLGTLENAGEAVWRRGLLRKGVGLCHGIAGNAFALLAVARCTGSAKWANRAASFGSFAVEHLEELEGVPDRPFSLFGGIGGLAALLFAITGADDDLSAAEFPCFCFDLLSCSNSG